MALITEEKDAYAHGETRSSSPDMADPVAVEDAREVSTAETAAFDRKLLFKLDILIIPIVAMLYLLAFLDRANIGNARVAGLQVDLKMTDHQFQTALTLTYVLYIAAEIPSNLVLKKIGPKRLLPGLCFCWGVVTTLQCLITSYSGLLAARLMLGLAEGGLFPGINLYLSMFYRRDELQLRIALFYSAASLSGAFSGLLAAAIAKMDGIAGLTGWQWIFCLEGLFTVAFSFVAYAFMPNNPHDVCTFNDDQKARCAARLQLESTFASTEKVTLRGVLSTYTSPHILILFVVMFFSGTLVFSLAYFTPSIVRGMGYSPIRTQLMTVPPFAVAFVVGIGVAYLADRYHKRGVASIATLTIALIGVIMFYKGRSNAVRYTALFFLISGVYASGPCFLSWIPNNTAAHTRRATAIATCFIFTNVGGIVSTWIFPTKDAPYYRFASEFILSLVVLSIVGTAVEIGLLGFLNKRKDSAAYREKVMQDVAHLSLPEQYTKLGDAHPDFKYFL